MSLLSVQQRFAVDAATLILKAHMSGWGVTLGEVWRSPEQAQWNAERGLGIANSLHTEKLAIDLNLFTPEGVYITDDRGHTELGAWWKSLGPDHYWGGDFSRKDFNHYSISPDGGKTR